MLLFLYFCSPCTFLAECISIALVTRPTQSSLTRLVISSVLGRWISYLGAFIGLCEPLFLSRCCWWARSAQLPACSFLQSCLLHPASSEDRALPKMLRRAAELGAAVCLPAATSSYKKGIERNVWQRSSTRKLETLDCFHTQTLLLPFPLAWLVEVAHPCPTGWEGAFIVCPTGHSHWPSPRLCVSSHCAKDYRHTTTTMMGYRSTACTLERISAND